MNVLTNTHENGVVPQSARRERHCSYCNSKNHNISKCSAYMDSIHQRYLDEYTNSPNPCLFRPYGRVILKRNLRLLALKNGLPVYDSRLETIESYYDKLHAHYMRLGRTERQVRLRINTHREELQAQQMPRAEVRHMAPPLSRFQRPMERRMLYDELFELDPTYFAQFLEDISAPEPSSPPPRREDTVQLRIDASKFESKDTSGECPVCLEVVENMVITECRHLFCQTCIMGMLKVNCRDLSCALCRGSVKDIYVHSQESMNTLMK